MMLTPRALLILALAGLCDAVWLTHAHLFGAAACGAGSGCDAVMASPYSRVAGIPLSTIGLGFYLAVAGLSWRALLPDLRDESLRWVSLLSAAGAVPTLALLYVQGFVIGAWCPFCLLSAVLLASILAASVLDRRHRDLLSPVVGALPGWHQMIPLLIAVVAPSLVFLGIDRGMPITSRVSSSSPDTAHVVARVGDREITLGEMNRALQMRLMDARNEIRNDWLDVQVLEAAALEKDLGVNDLLRQEVDSRLSISQQDVDRFYERNKARMPAGVPRENLNRQIRDQLLRERGQQARASYISDLRRRYGAELTPPPVERFTVDSNPRGGPERGPSDAPVTIIAFSDLECGHCADSHRQLDELQRQRPDDIRLIFRHFPLDMHPQARYAAEVASCADRQDQFWPLLEVLFQNQQQLQGRNVRGYAEKLGLDMQQLKTCLQSGEGRAVVNADFAEGEELGISSTPSFFINGHFMVGLPPGDGLNVLIDRELAAGGR